MYDISISAGKDGPLTLDEMLEHFLTIPTEQINEHFRPMTHMCEIGHVPYDYIADVDNATQCDEIARRSGMPAFSEVTERYVHKDTRVIKCTARTVDLAATLYREDLYRLGYSMVDAYHSCRTYGRPFAPSTSKGDEPKS